MGIDDTYYLAEIAVDLAQKAGARYVEARLQRLVGRTVTLRNGVPDPLDFYDSLGLGIRILTHDNVLVFGSTNKLSRESVEDLVDSLSSAGGTFRGLGRLDGLSREDPAIASWSVDERRRIEDMSLDGILAEAHMLDGTISDVGSQLVNRWFTLGSSVEEKYILTSEGTRITSRVPRILVLAMLTAHENGRVMQRFVEIGGSGGWELLEVLGVEDELRVEALDLVEVVKKAVGEDVSDIDSVIVGPEISGIMAHESIGHPFEADRILGREAAQAGESYLSRNSLGMEMGNDEAHVSDDPTIPHSYGFYLFDDEGVRARKKRLLLAGRVNELLHDRETAYVFGVGSNASSRASSYDREPIPRMSNTFVEPGDYRLEEILEEAGRAVLMESYMEWNIDDKRMNQRYVGLKAYLVENGERRGMVLNPVLEVTSDKLWPSVVARGRELEFSAGTCGKGEPMQGVPVWMGGPYMLLRGVKVRRR